MKIALLGCDDEALALVRSALAAGGHELVAGYDLGSFRGQVQELAPRARLDESWETLLAGRDAEAVVVGRGKVDPPAESGISAEDRRCDQLRKLAQEAVPLLIVHPACEMLVAYEIEMIRAASGGVIVPFVPGLLHPALAELQELAGGSPPALGEVELVQFERQMIDRSRDSVLVQFARDVAWLTRFVGNLRQIAATGPAGSEYEDPLAAKRKSLPSLSNLSVHLSGDRPFPARWSVSPADDQPGAKLTLIAARGKAMLHIPASPSGTWKLETFGPQAECREFAPREPAPEALDRLQLSIREDHAPEFSWLDACHVLEAAASIDRSLEKGRAVPLFTEEVTEEQSFKGIMAVGGCLLLVVTLAGVLIAALVEGLQLEFRNSPYWRPWPLYLLMPVLLFLVLQILQIVAKGAGKPPPRPTPDRPR